MKFVFCAISMGVLLQGVSGQSDDPLARAENLYQKGHYAQALESLVSVGEEEMGGAAAMLQADCQQKLGQLSEALENYDRARLLGYDGDDLILHRGICKTSLGLYEAARFDLHAYIQRHTGDAAAYYWMASLEYLSQESKVCLRYVNEAIYLDSTYSEAYYLRGACYATQNKLLMAIDDFKMAYELNPTLERSKLNMASLLIDMGQFNEAVELLSELALQNIDFTSEVLYYRGEANYALHDIDGACHDWQEAAALGDADAQASHKRICLDNKGKPRLKQRMYVQF